jgi:broad specificity phosphatase PhoE
VGTVYYVSHPQVRIDPAVPVPRWSLSPTGRARLVAVLGRPWAAGLKAVIASDEVKAVETATLLAEASGAELTVAPGLHENDRSATGFLPPAEFETVADAFFARPDASVRGWERAVDAQARVVAAVRRALAAAPAGDIAFSGHGGVGTLLSCALAGDAIDRRFDQPPNGGGNVFAFDRATLRVLHRWRPIEDARIGEPE